jgi:hypothetical protein
LLFWLHPGSSTGEISFKVDLFKIEKAFVEGKFSPNFFRMKSRKFSSSISKSKEDII